MALSLPAARFRARTAALAAAAHAWVVMAACGVRGARRRGGSWYATSSDAGVCNGSSWYRTITLSLTWDGILS